MTDRLPVCDTPRLLNTSQPELINFGILLSHIACDITISLEAQYCIDYVVPIQPLAVIPNKSFVHLYDVGSAKLGLLRMLYTL